MEFDYNKAKEKAAEHYAESNEMFKANLAAINEERRESAKRLEESLSKVAQIGNENRRRQMQAEQEKTAKENAEAIRANSERKSLETWNESEKTRSMREMLNNMKR